MSDFLNFSSSSPPLHPFSYYSKKTDYFNNILDEISKKDISKNDGFYQITNFGIYKKKYEELNKKKIAEKLKEKKWKNPDSFESIFEDKDRKRQNEMKNNQIRKEKYFKELLENPQDTLDDLPFEPIISQIQEKIEIKLEQFKKEKDEEALINYLSSNYNKKNILQSKSQINLSYGGEKFEHEEYKIPIENFNSKIVNVLGQNILNTMHEYFDEVFDALMEDVLEEEVLFLNQMESIKEDNKLTEEEEKNYFDAHKPQSQHKEYVSQKVLDIFGKLENLID